MSLWLQIKYASLISNRLERYKVKSTNPFVANFRCPYCGDSEKTSYKARGYFYQRNGKVVLFCHNCGIPKDLSFVLKDFDQYLYKEYCLELFRNDSLSKPKNTQLDLTKTPKPKLDIFSKLQRVSELSNDHVAKNYLIKRCIPKDKLDLFYYTDTFNKWTNSLVPNKLPEENDEPRIVIPFRNKNREPFGFQGRSLNYGKYSLRYITVMLEEYHKVFGLDRVDLNKTVYLTEGPFDSLFVPNSLAMCGADIPHDVLKKNDIIIFDNEKRSKEILKKMQKAIEKGYTVFFWPDDIKVKDVNELKQYLITNNIDKEPKDIIDSNLYRGLEAMMKLAEWKRA